MMKAMVLNSYGEDAEFELMEIEKPQVKPGHILVKIAASSVNTVDTMIRKTGKELPLSPDIPAILGMDCHSVSHSWRAARCLSISGLVALDCGHCFG